MKPQSRLLDGGRPTSDHQASLLPAWIATALKEPRPSAGAENSADLHD